MNNNIFSTLSRFSGSAENFLTEAFVYLINQLLIREFASGRCIIQKLIGEEETLISEKDQVSVTTQLTLDEGRPDICIRTSPDSLFFIEVKHDSPLHKGQLEAYYSELVKSGKSKHKLILLTRSKQTAIQTTLSKVKFRQICWYEIFNWLSMIKSKDETIRFLTNNFLSFLEDKAMNLIRVEWEYPNGLKSLINLTNMLEAAIEEVYEIKLKKTGGWSWRGFYIDKVFCGVRYDMPYLIVFENNMGTNPSFKTEFDIEKEHFLALSKDEQFECLVKFILESSENYRNIHQTESSHGTVVSMEDVTEQ